MVKTKRRRKIRRKTKHNRIRKNLVGGSFTEAGHLFSHFLNNVASTFTVPIPSSISFDPRITNQFIYQK